MLKAPYLRPTLRSVAVTAACLLPACAISPRRTPEERVADANVASRVESTLLSDPNIYARHIDVAVVRGVVHLGGYVWEPEDFQAAKRDAASVPGVTAVAMEMQLMRGGLAGSR
jgi:osmotically-inducible protein OsmY